MIERLIKIITGGILIIVIVLPGCRHEPYIPDDMAQLCYDVDIKPIMLSNCAYAGCHDAITKKEDIDLSSYESLMASDVVEPGKPRSSELYKVLFENGDDKMPPPPKPSLSSDAESHIYLWILQGAKNDCPTNLCDSSNVSYTHFIKPFNESYCKSCHLRPSPSGGVPLENYADLKAIGIDGSFVGTLTNAPGYHLMPPGNQLGSCEIKKVEKWIREGYSN